MDLAINDETLRDNMYWHQDGLCLICKKEMIGRDCHEDHDHRTGEIRGLLCRSCNLMLGHAADDPKILVRGARYLKGSLRSPATKGLEKPDELIVTEEQAVDHLNKTFTMVTYHDTPGSCMATVRIYDGRNFLAITNFEHQLNGQVCMKEGKVVSRTSAWLNSSKRKICRGKFYPYPGKTPEGMLNVYVSVVNELPQLIQNILHLHFVEGLTVDEVADKILDGKEQHDSRMLIYDTFKILDQITRYSNIKDLFIAKSFTALIAKRGPFNEYS